MEENTVLRRFRSRLNALSLDLKCELGELSMQKGMTPAHRKDLMMKALDNYIKGQWAELGTGTNRFIFRTDGYAVKVALDKEGIADNRQEWVMSSMLNKVMEGATPCWEISKGGHLLVASYTAVFPSYNEMMNYAQSIKKILEAWGKRFLLGDCGLDRKNYGNWGLLNGKPTCLDYGYIFPANLDLFECLCGNKELEFANSNYTGYKCPKCGHHWDDADIRMRISQQQRLEMFENVPGIEMHEAEEMHMAAPEFIKANDNPDAPDPYRSVYEIQTCEWRR